MKTITKDQFVSILEEAGIGASQRTALHRVLERRNPAAHEELLQWLGLPAADVQAIREHARR